MTDYPGDLMPLTEVLKQFKPARKFWQTRIHAGEITAYRLPGERGYFLSRAAVERILAPQRLQMHVKPSEHDQTE